MENALTIQKALSKKEKPVKEKHARPDHRHPRRKGSIALLAAGPKAADPREPGRGVEVLPRPPQAAPRRPPQRHPPVDPASRRAGGAGSDVGGGAVVAWKFCHVLHKLLRDGHPNVIPQSIRHRAALVELGRTWGEAREAHGNLVKCYVDFLLTKLKFHENYPGFPGNVQVSEDRLQLLGGNDINYYFQLGAAIFDYLEDILALQSADWSRLSKSRFTEKHLVRSTNEFSSSFWVDGSESEQLVDQSRITVV
ncbi:unnamed protein product [Darwinula stevensoni]|uniref:ENTH domain-containing protein n=1 Tax=Darwinula stevensoni TaxID=69355 RepID=A0A7R9A1L3_9CRUS|nr:unnamed protein product [Darwinula stevensoni]CAG0886886.1 unnamed protein product [Darwinula stevensoni]